MIIIHDFAEFVNSKNIFCAPENKEVFFFSDNDIINTGYIK